MSPFVVVLMMVACFVAFVCYNCIQERSLFSTGFGFVALAFLLLMAATTVVENQNRVNDAYAAASKQGVTITTKAWRQKPVATQPCRVELKLDGKGRKARLLLPNSGKKVTQDMLNAVCNG